MIEKNEYMLLRTEISNHLSLLLIAKTILVRDYFILFYELLLIERQVYLISLEYTKRENLLKKKVTGKTNCVFSVV